MDKRKIQYGIVVLMLAFVFMGCGQKKKNDVKVYENKIGRASCRERV